MNPEDLKPSTTHETSGRDSGEHRTAMELSADLKVHQIELEMQNHELREAQLSLEVSRQRYFSLFDLAPIPYFVFSEKHIVEEMNLVATELLGSSRREITQRAFSLHLTEESRPAFHDHLRRTFEGESLPATELRVMTKAGTLRHVIARSTLLPVEGESRRRVLTACMDVTGEREAESRQKSLEAELRQSQKMEALGLLAGGMAHDFNNILQVISGFADLALSQSEDQRVRESIQHVLSASDRAAKLTRQILAFGSRQPIETTVLSLNELVSSLSPMLSRLVRSDIEIRTSLESGLLPVLADRSQIEQVLMNLVINARDAIKEGRGEIEITTTSVPGALTPKNRAVLCDASAIVVRDTGIGMSPETIARIFEPFYTTKPRSRGTGLGLSVVHGIMQQHGGEIRVDSRVGKGTTFTVLLPVTDREQIVPTQKAAPNSGGGGQWILMAEDEPALRDLNKAILDDLGYRVISAHDGADAVERYRAHRGEPIALLLFDIIMPRLSGVEAYRILSDSPDCPPVLFVSGYPGEAPIETNPERGVWFLRKPYREADLRMKIGQCLHGARRSGQ